MEKALDKLKKIRLGCIVNYGFSKGLRKNEARLISTVWVLVLVVEELEGGVCRHDVMRLSH
jgi:hypothetical protein